MSDNLFWWKGGVLFCVASFFRLNKRGQQQGSIRSREGLKRAGSQE